MSSLPRIVTDILWSSKFPLESVARTVYSITSDSPRLRLSKVSSPLSKLQFSEPNVSPASMGLYGVMSSQLSAVDVLISSTLEPLASMMMALSFSTVTMSQIC